jgi:hypothetical protein
MYCLKRTTDDSISYYKYNGWETFPKSGPLDLTGSILFTEREAQVNELPPNERFQWYGAYK